jgi:hypothetical protein
MGVTYIAVVLMLLHGGGQPQKPQQRERNKNILELEESIKGKENQPAEQVWKNIQLFKGMPAARVLRIMEGAYTQALGVSCDYCHVDGKWESDENKHKQIARRMAGMTRDLNQTLKTVTGESDATVNCITCHRGDTKPATSLPGTMRRGGG